MTQKKLLTEMQRLNFRKVIILLNLFFCANANAQVEHFFSGNIQIKDTSLVKILDGFYDYLKDKKNGEFNGGEYYVRVNLSATNDSTDYIELLLYNYAMASLEKKASQYYGYLKRENVYIVFSNKSRLIKKLRGKKNIRILNIKKAKKNYPKNPYDPYRWEFVVSNGKVIQQVPSDTIKKYITLSEK